MDSSKRNFLSQIISYAVVAPLGLAAARGFAPRPDPQVKQVPSTPDPPNPFGGPNAKVDMQKILKHNQEEIHDSVEKIFDLATELKAEVEKTNSADVLSLPLIQKSEQIEKLAKQVKTLARGN
jgi:hypothetical protein